MLNSMTAYGKGRVKTSFGHLTVEITSVNRKFLEVQLFLPKELAPFEKDLRLEVNQCCHRGQLTIKVSFSFEKDSSLTIRPNITLAKQLKEAYLLICSSLDIPACIDLSMLSKEKSLLIIEEKINHENSLKECLLKAAKEALSQLSLMKAEEGKALVKDLKMRLAILSLEIEAIALQSPFIAEKLTQRLKKCLNDLVKEMQDHEERIIREVALYANKTDICEEIVRFNSHLQQFQEFIQKKPEFGVGKTLEFILQEMFREIQTIGSKSQDLEITKRVIKIKTELERLKEQVQNIE